MGWDNDSVATAGRVIEVRRASDLGERCRPRISAIFVEGFGKDLRAFSKDPQKLTRALEHIFVLEVFYVAVVEGEIAAIASCTERGVQAIDHDRQQLIKHLGFVRGMVATTVFQQYFQKPPEKTGDRIATVGFVTTASGYRSRGVARALLEHIHATLPYDEFILEAADNNVSAIRLYEQLGYREFRRVKQRYSKLSGFDYMVHMNLTK